MSGFLPDRAVGDPGRLPDAPQLERSLTREERRSRWAVRAAQWRARELAEIVFGEVARSSLVGLRLGGPARGLLQLDVPFADLETHRAREARFLAAAGADPVLSQVPEKAVEGVQRVAHRVLERVQPRNDDEGVAVATAMASSLRLGSGAVAPQRDPLDSFNSLHVYVIGPAAV